ncbi:MAG: hypothetical protein ACYCZI_11430 [Metallibacterium scheffleri]
MLITIRTASAHAQRACTRLDAGVWLTALCGRLSRMRSSSTGSLLIQHSSSAHMHLDRACGALRCRARAGRAQQQALARQRGGVALQGRIQRGAQRLQFLR